ncbi:MAG: glutamate dehydrogenase, partial [Akkermansiaceae bacterium]|nr:glutamate dehydrogenase [Akkermansiaceae bacterium]
LFRESRIAFGPAKAANAGGVGVSGLVQSQNALRIAWPKEEVDKRLQGIMSDIHDQCVEHGELDDGHVDYVKGANIGGFIRVADAMLNYGYV